MLSALDAAIDTDFIIDSARDAGARLSQGRQAKRSAGQVEPANWQILENVDFGIIGISKWC